MIVFEEALISSSGSKPKEDKQRLSLASNYQLGIPSVFQTKLPKGKGSSIGYVVISNVRAETNVYSTRGIIARYLGGAVSSSVPVKVPERNESTAIDAFLDDLGEYEAFTLSGLVKRFSK